MKQQNVKHKPMSSDDVSKLKPFGYNGLFAARDSLNDVMNWCHLHNGDERVIAVTAACMAINTLLLSLHTQGCLRLHSPQKQRRIIVVAASGVYQNTLANFDCDDIELAHVEYDAYGNSEDMVAIPQSNGNTALAYASVNNIVTAESERTLSIDAVFNAIHEHDRVHDHAGY
jgi:hypothetical protein